LLVPLFAHGRGFDYLQRFLILKFPRTVPATALLAAQYFTICFCLAVAGTVASNYFAFLKQASADIADGKGQRASAVIRAVNQAKQAADTRMLVFVPPETAEFWHLVEKCRSKSFFIPAMTGVPMLKGLPPLSTGCDHEHLKGYGYDAYGPDSRSRSMTKLEACHEAGKLGFSSVFVLREPLRSNNHELWDCSQSAASSDAN
jgi:hypothetical protein